MKANLIPVDRIRAVLRYEPDTGRFFWKEKTSDKVVVGREAGNGTGRRDVRISVDGVLYQGHRLAWVIMTGEQPPQHIDHKDMDTRNNRWENLRGATCSTNGANRPAPRTNTTGMKGVYYYPNVRGSKKWMARITKDRKLMLNKMFATKEEAASAYRKAAVDLFGEFARV